MGGSGDDTFIGDSGDNHFQGGFGADTFSGGAGKDEVIYNDGLQDGVVVTFDGIADDGGTGEGDNVRTDIEGVRGTNGNDRLYAGTDLLVGGPANDVFILGRNSTGGQAFGNDGDDVFINQNGSTNAIDGGNGFDSAQDDDTDTAAGGLQNDTFTNIEYIYDVLNAGLSTLIAATAPPPARLSGLAVAAAASTVGVKINGSGHNRVLRITGTTDSDKITLTQTGATVKVVTQVGTAAAATASFATSAFDAIAIDASGSTDILTYTYRNALVTINGSTGHVTSDGSENDKIIAVEYLVGGRANDVIIGSNVNDVLFGGKGDDNISGGPGADEFHSGFGSDTLNPNGGFDFIDTGGNDGSDDSVIGKLDSGGVNPVNRDDVVIAGSFDRHDYFTLSRRHFGEAVPSTEPKSLTRRS